MSTFDLNFSLLPNNVCVSNECSCETAWKNMKDCGKQADLSLCWLPMQQHKKTHVLAQLI